jgi:hypothetical protein
MVVSVFANNDNLDLRGFTVINEKENKVLEELNPELESVGIGGLDWHRKAIYSPDIQEEWFGGNISVYDDLMAVSAR